MYKNFVKSILDRILAFLVLCLCVPFFIVISILVKATSKGPVFFTQERLGKNAKVFKLYKFRTMSHKEREVDREIFSGDPEVTKIGVILRRYKIDEMPQLLNVLFGNMAIVGPRPSMPELQKSFNEDGAYRIKVLPGLTGLAQINGNIYLSWPKRWEYDRHYAENLSFVLDMKIIFKTFAILIYGEEKFKEHE